jgi:hypothetical protein
MRAKKIIGAAAVMALCFSVGISLPKQMAARAADLNGAQGRYVLTQCQFQSFDENGNVGKEVAPFLVDTATGQTWIYSGSDLKTLNSRRTAALGVPGFERVQFIGMAKEEKDGSFTVQPSYFPQ